MLVLPSIHPTFGMTYLGSPHKIIAKTKDYSQGSNPHLSFTAVYYPGEIAKHL